LMGMGGAGGMDALQALGSKVLGPEAAEALKSPEAAGLLGLGGSGQKPPTLPGQSLPGLGGGAPFNPFRKP